MIDTVKLTADRGIMHALLCVVRLMDDRETADDTLVFRASMPSLGSLFRDGEQMLTLREATERALAIVEGS